MTSTGGASAQGTSPASAAPIGTTVSGIIGCGEGYTSHELYNARVTVLRGEAARRQLEAAGNAAPPPAGHDYLYAQIRFEYEARGKPGTCPHVLQPNQFHALSAMGSRYPDGSVVSALPMLGGRLRSGDRMEGWVTFFVPQADRSPLMLFSVDHAGAVQQGGDLWLRLY